MSSIAPRADAERIASLNDSFRTTFIGGSIFVSSGVQALGPGFVADALAGVRTFDDFTGGNDPYKEHDFGSVLVQGQKLFWKIDYYDQSMLYGSDDPSDPKVTCRVLTVLLAEEY